MSKDVRRAHPRVSYEQKIRLLGADGKPVIVGRTLNLSPSGIYVRAPAGCEIGSEVTCDLPLPGGTRQLRGRVARTQSLPDDSTGIGIQFVDLTTGDSSSLHRALEGSAARPVMVKVAFEGMARPIKCHGIVTAEGIRLSTSLPFLRLGSDVSAVYEGRDGKIDASGVLTGVRLEPVAGDGVPRLGVDVDIESERPLAAETPGPGVGGAAPDATVAAAATAAPFSRWDQPPVVRSGPRGERTRAAGEIQTPPPVVRPHHEGDGPTVLTDGAELDLSETTAITTRPGALSFLVDRLESLHAWGFVVVATLTFSIVYATMNQWSRAEEGAGRGREAPVAPTPSAKPVRPLIVPAPSHEGVALATDAVGARTAVVSDAASMPRNVAVPDAHAGGAGSERVAKPAARPRPATPPPFRYDPASGRYQLRAGATLDMHGTAITGVAGLAASDDVAGNLRGINVAVEAGVLYMPIQLEHAEADARFAVQVTPSWPTPIAIVGKTTTGFTASFGTPAPEGAHLDWFLVR